MRLFCVLLLAFCAPAWSAPGRISAEFDLVSRGVTIGHVKESFVRSGDTYEIESVSRSQGLLKVFFDETITLHSRGRVDGGGLRPMSFEERRTREPRRNVQATFDWERGVMHSRFRGEESRHELPPATQDRISMMYQFMHVKPRAGDLTLSMSNGRKVERYTYRLVDEARVETPAGEFDTLHFARVPTEPNDRHVEVWLAKAHHNFPVRVLYDDGGLRVEQALVALKID